jgi:hypothetical protein
MPVQILPFSMLMTTQTVHMRPAANPIKTESVMFNRSPTPLIQPRRARFDQSCNEPVFKKSKAVMCIHLGQFIATDLAAWVEPFENFSTFALSYRRISRQRRSG